MPLTPFHPATARWFERQLGRPTAAQEGAWPAIHRGRHVLVAAPTGSGKTLAAFLAALDDLVRESLACEDGLPDETRVVYVSPLKALSNDVHRNLELPLAGIEAELAAEGLPAARITRAVRTGDTPSSHRQRMTRTPPHVLVTTPESLYILLGSDGGRNLLSTARTVIVDEIHAVAGNKRGSHLALTLERLDELVSRSGGRLTRIGLSATQKPVSEVARFLTGGYEGGGDDEGVEIVDVGHRRPLDLAVEVTASPLEAVMPNEVWEEVYDRLAELIAGHRTTLVFVNTRRLAERASRHLAERLGNDAVAAHHGSLSKEQRLDSEQRLKEGRLAALVATASMELGIDIGSVDLVCQLGSTRSISALLQRVGRAGHEVGGVSKGRLFPLTRDELVESAALVDAVARGELDRLEIPPAPLDILAQHLVAAAAEREWGEDELFDLVRRAWPYRELPRESFDAVVEMLAQGFSTRRGRRAAYLHHDAVNRRLRGRRNARLTALTSGGAIPDTADYPVVLEPAGSILGSVNEDFAVESMPGDIFQLGNAAWRILKIERGQVRVEDAAGEPPNIPFWFGEAPGRSDELSAAVSRLSAGVEARLEGADAGEEEATVGRDAAATWLAEELGLPAAAAVQLADYLAAGHAALSALPTRETLVVERFFDEAGDTHLVIHSPYGSRINRAWGLALRKRFCRSFNFELQAAAGEDAIVLSLGPTHSFPLETVFSFLSAATVREVLVQAVLDSPLFGVRWRWNACRSLALPRMRGGTRVPPQLQRHRAEDLLAVVFPDQLACLENVEGDREVPDHPLVEETLRDCLTEAMDVAGLERLLGRIEAGPEDGGVRCVARELTEPSPLAHEILNANPYAFLDDAPLEERRTQAVVARRWLDVETAADLGRLDGDEIRRVRDEADLEPRDREELHDALVTGSYLPARQGREGGWEGWFDELVEAGRAALLFVDREAGDEGTNGRGANGSGDAPARQLWVAAERTGEVRAAYGESVRLEPDVPVPPRLAREWEPDAAVVELVRARLGVLGPVTASDLAAESGLARGGVERALAVLEGEGFVMRGRFTPGAATDGEEEWCERRLLARIHRYTLNRLRREIRPVGRADLARFLLVWQRVAPGEKGEGPEALAAVLEQLAGFAAPAAAWEGEILPARVAGYEPGWLDALCLAGRFVWCRLAPPDGGRTAPLRTTPITFLPRADLQSWRRVAGADGEPTEADGGDAPDGGPDDAPMAALPEGLSSDAAQVAAVLAERGAMFFSDLARAAGLLETRAESALAELVASGLVSSDSFTGLRALLLPAHRRPTPDRGRRGGGIATPFGMQGAGRWWLLSAVADPGDTTGAAAPAFGWSAPPEVVEAVARTLLQRYGVVFRALLAREDLVPPWRELLWVLRRLEARGEVRGGRFVDGFSGEQFALPEAVARLRSLRRQRRREGGAAVEAIVASSNRVDNGGEAPSAVPPEMPLISVSGADPLNLAGILTAGRRLPALTGNRLLYRDGEPVAVFEAQAVRFLAGEEAIPSAQRWQAEKALIRTPVTPALRPYLN